MAAAVGVTETTKEPTVYDHPTNPKIKFWDLPGIGTPKYPDLETYCKEVELEKYHAFLIFTASRFTENDLNLAKKIRSIKKQFFFIRTKIDNDVRSEKRKRSFNERAMLEKIRRDCAENLNDLLSNEQDIFLISNHHPPNWDFDRLTQAILEALPLLQRESLTLSLGVLTSLSTEMLKRKVEVLKGRIWMVAGASAAVALIPIPGLSLAVDTAVILKETTFYRSQLGLPTEGSAEFARLQANNQENIRSICLTTVAQIQKFLTAYATEACAEEVARFIPYIGPVVASGMSFGTVFCALRQYLKKVEDTALAVLKEATKKSSRDLDIA